MLNLQPKKILAADLLKRFVLSSAILPLSISFTSGLFGTTTALAQSADQLVEPNYAPHLQQTPSGGIELPTTTGLAAPKGAEKLFISVSNVQIEGSFQELEFENQKFITSLKGRNISAAELFDSARNLEAAYIRAGYLFVRVSLPAQEIDPNGDVRFIITDGYISNINTSSLPSHLASRVAKTLQPIVGKRKLQKSEFERRLLLAGDIPGIKLRSTLSPGHQPGSARLILQSDYTPINSSVIANSNVSDALGGYSLGVSTQVNSLFGKGEVFYGSIAGYPTNNTGDSVLSSDPRNRQIALGTIIPLNTNGLNANIEYVDSRTHPLSDLGISSKDHFQKFSSRINFTRIRSRHSSQTTTLTFDLVEQNQFIVIGNNQIQSSKDGLSILRLSQTAHSIFGNSELNFSASFSKGLDIFVAREGTQELPTGRQGINTEFEKIQASLNYQNRLNNNNLLLSAFVEGQLSFGNALPSSEQIGFTGANRVSGYSPGSVNGDSGIFSRVEFARLLPITSDSQSLASTSLMPYFFGTAAYSTVEKPTAIEFRNETINAMGVGVRIFTKIKGVQNNVMLNLEYGRALSDRRKKDDRLNLSLSTRF